MRHPADTFLKQLDQPGKSIALPGEPPVRESLMELSGIRNKITTWDTRPLAAQSAPRRPPSRSPSAGREDDLIPALPPPAASSAEVAAKREATRFPAVMPGAATAAPYAAAAGHAGSQPMAVTLAAAAARVVAAARTAHRPPSPAPADSPLLRAARGAASAGRGLAVATSAAASDVFHSATSRLASSTGDSDLSALQKAVMALKTASSSASQPAAAVAPPPRPAPSTSFKTQPPTVVLPAAVPAPVAAPAPASPPSPPASAAIPAASHEEEEEEAEAVTPLMRLATTPDAPANTPASPLLAAAEEERGATAARLAAAFQRAQHEAAPAAAPPAPSPAPLISLASPLEAALAAMAPFARCAPSPSPTEYDGDDVVMGDATPGRAGERRRRWFFSVGGACRRDEALPANSQ